MTKRILTSLSMLVVIGWVVPTASADCWKCSIAGGRASCEQVGSSDTGHDFCEDSSSCGPSGCSSSCLPSGGGCTGAGSGGNCRVLSDGTVICEEHKAMRTLNGEEWPEPVSSPSSAACAA